MATAQVSVEIERPLTEVFEFVAAIENLPKWTPVIVDTWPLTGTPPEPGSTYMVRAHVMGRTMEIPSEVTGFEKDRLFAYRSEGAMGYENTVTFEQTQSGTRMTERIDMPSPGGLAGLLTPLKLFVSRRSHGKSQQVLKQLLEAGPPQ